MEQFSSRGAGRPFRPADAIRLRFPGAAGFLRDEDIFYTISEVSEDLSADRTTLWLLDARTNATHRIGGEFADVASPVASPDGRRIAFIATVDGATQICGASVDTDEVEVLTHLPQGVGGSLAWAPDGRSIAFTAGPSKKRDPGAPYWITRSTYRFEGLGYVDDVIQDIYVLDVETREVRQLTADSAMNTSPKWSPDGRRLLFLVSFEPDADWSFRPQLHTVDVASGTRRLVLGEEWGGIVSAIWAADGEHIVFAGAPAADAVSVFARKYDLWTVDASGGEPRCHTESLKAGVGSRVQTDVPTWDVLGDLRICPSRAGDAVYVISQNGVNIDICRVGLDTEGIERVLSGPGAHVLLDVGEADRLLYAFSTLEQTPDLFVNQRGRHDASQRVTSLNAEALDGVSLAPARWMRVTAPDGLELDTCILSPAAGAAPHPAVLCIHGGPYGAYGDTFMTDFHVLAGAGFAVVFSNFRGSGGYGTEFSEKIVGRWGPVGTPDHLAAIERAVELGVADSSRLGVYGLSHGGFATCWLVGNTDRFKAGIAENPVTNWVTGYGVSDAPSWIPLELGGLPHQVPEKYAELSPLTYAPRCTTPLLFIIGESDLRCPPCDSEQYYRVLKSTGCPTAMLRLPNSNHVGTWTGPPAARNAQNEALVEWFRRYLAPGGVNAGADADSRSEELRAAARRS